MSIKGAEGLSIEDVRNEIQRGGRLVVYLYVISLIVVSFKRSTDVRLVKAGQSAVVHGIPWTVISLLLGWWGIPWGIFYTLEAFFKNLSGGVDVTNEWLAATAHVENPRYGEAPPRHEPLQPGEVRVSSSAPVLVPEKSPMRFLLPAFLLVFVVGAGVCIRPFYLGRNHPVILVNGLEVPYVITVGKDTHTVANGQPLELNLVEDVYEVRAQFPKNYQPAYVETVDLRTPFVDRIAGKKVTFINPDKLALIYRERVRYSEVPRADEESVITIFANKSVVQAEAPDYLAGEDFPASVSVTRNSHAFRTRMTALSGLAPFEMFEVIRSKGNLHQVSHYAMRLAAFYPENLQIVQQALTVVEPPAVEAFFAQHLATRPILVDWHRLYQDYSRGTTPREEVLSRYRKWSAEEPENGELIYLVGRLLPDRAEADACYERALKAPIPSCYVWNALTYECASDGKFVEVLACVEKGIAAGNKSESLPSLRRWALLGLGQRAQAYAETKALFSAHKDDLMLAEYAALLAGNAGSPVGEADVLAGTFLQAVRADPTNNVSEQVRTSLRAMHAYGRGDLAAYLREGAMLRDWPRMVLPLAISSKDHRSAAELIKEEKIPTSPETWFSLYIAAVLKKDTAEADAYYRQAILACGENLGWGKGLADALRAHAESDPEKMARVLATPETKRVLFCALGLRYPGHREAYFRWARLMNGEPTFPHLLLTEAMGVGAFATPAQ